jgi:hypothetical protein
VEQVVVRYDPDQFIPFGHWRTPDIFSFHEFQRFLNRHFWSDSNYWIGHPLFYQHFIFS